LIVILITYNDSITPLEEDDEDGESLELSGTMMK